MLEWQNSTFFPHFFEGNKCIDGNIYFPCLHEEREGKKLFWAIDSNTTLMASSVCLLYFPQFLACRVKNTQDYFRLLIKERESSSFKFSPFFTFLFSKKEVFYGNWSGDELWVRYNNRGKSERRHWCDIIKHTVQCTNKTALLQLPGKPQD